MEAFKDELDYINKLIDTTKKNLAKYPVSEELLKLNSTLKQGDINYVCNKYYSEELQLLEKIKIKLEAFDIVKKKVIQTDTISDRYGVQTNWYEFNTVGDEEISVLYKGLGVE